MVRETGMTIALAFSVDDECDRAIRNGVDELNNILDIIDVRMMIGKSFGIVKKDNLLDCEKLGYELSYFCIPLRRDR